MRIGVNTLFCIPGQVGGTETYLRCLLPEIARRSDDEIVLFTHLENDTALRNDLAAFDSIRYERLSFKASNRYARIIREQTELVWRVHQANLDVLWSPGYTLPLLVRPKQVVTIHDMQYRSHPDDLGWLARLTTDILVRLAARRARYVVTDSEFAGREIATYTSATREKIRVVECGVDRLFGEPVDDTLRTDIRRLVGHAPYVLTVANSYPHKNLPTLARAYGIAATDVPHALVIVGRERLGEPELKTTLSELPATVGDRVIRLAGLDTDVLRGLYQMADLFVFPSLYEGFGLPVLEAMMAQTPVITTRQASIPEVGGDFVDYVDDATDADELARRMVQALESDTARHRVADAKDRATAMSWEKSATAVLDVLRSATN
jgi:glycosyltransferase involved in cell wall biosynthesis